MYIYQLMQDFFHQLYDWNCLNKSLKCYESPLFDQHSAPPQLAHKQEPSAVAPHPTLIEHDRIIFGDLNGVVLGIATRSISLDFSVWKVAYRCN